MAYCTKDDLVASITEATLIELADDRKPDLSEEDREAAIETVITAAIDKAANEMDSILSIRYPQLPLPNASQLTDANTELAIYRLFNRRQLGDTDDVKARRTNTIKWLENVRDRKANIIGINDQTKTQDGDGSVIVKQGKSSNFEWSGY